MKAWIKTTLRLLPDLADRRSFIYARSARHGGQHRLLHAWLAAPCPASSIAVSSLPGHAGWTATGRQAAS